MNDTQLIAELSSALRRMIDAFSLDNEYDTVRDAMSRRLAAYRHARDALNLADERLHLAVLAPRVGSES